MRFLRTTLWRANGRVCTAESHAQAGNLNRLGSDRRSPCTSLATLGSSDPDPNRIKGKGYRLTSLLWWSCSLEQGRRVGPDVALVILPRCYPHRSQRTEPLRLIVPQIGASIERLACLLACSVSSHRSVDCNTRLLLVDSFVSLTYRTFYNPRLSFGGRVVTQPSCTAQAAFLHIPREPVCCSGSTRFQVCCTPFSFPAPFGTLSSSLSLTGWKPVAKEGPNKTPPFVAAICPTGFKRPCRSNRGLESLSSCTLVLGPCPCPCPCPWPSNPLSRRVQFSCSRARPMVKFDS